MRRVTLWIHADWSSDFRDFVRERSPHVQFLWLPRRMPSSTVRKLIEEYDGPVCIVLPTRRKTLEQFANVVLHSHPLDPEKMFVLKRDPDVTLEQLHRIDWEDSLRKRGRL